MNCDRFLIETDELLTKINKPDIRIFDATIMFYIGLSPEQAAKMPTAKEQYLAGHIPGAVFFDHQLFSDPISDYEYMLAPDGMLAEQIGEIGISNDSEVILYTTAILACATRAWWILRYAGLENVRVLNGGFAAWKNAGGSVEQEEQKYSATHFMPQFNPAMIASLAEVKAGIDTERVNIENTLMQDWYDDEHIPGSSCLPLTDLMVEWDAYKTGDQLAARLNNYSQHERIITYCGGGIAATLNAMAYMMAGYDNVAVYDGSLYEWIGEGMPVAGKG